MSEGTEIIETGPTDEQLSDAESIMEELEDKYEDDAQAIIGILTVCLAAMMEATGTLQINWASDDGCQLYAQCSPGFNEETLH